MDRCYFCQKPLTTREPTLSPPSKEFELCRDCYSVEPARSSVRHAHRRTPSRSLSAMGKARSADVDTRRFSDSAIVINMTQMLRAPPGGNLFSD